MDNQNKSYVDRNVQKKNTKKLPDSIREEKTSIEQKEIYVSFMESNEAFRTKKASDKSVDFLWDEITQLLNAAKGPNKTKADWKKVFDNWRYVTNFKARALKVALNKTGGGINKGKPLSELKNRALVVWGKIVVEGHPEVSSVGFQECPIELEYIDLGDIQVQQLENDPTSLPESSERPRIGRLTAGDKQFQQFAEQAEQERLRARVELNSTLKEISGSLKEVCGYLKIIAEKS